MNAPQRGFLLLTSHLGDPQSKPLTVAQFRRLIGIIRALEPETQDREMVAADLIRLGYSASAAENILQLMSRQQQLNWYLSQADLAGISCLTRAHGEYPGILRNRLGLDCPGCLWLKGEKSLLQKKAVSLVGSRELRPDNQAFAAQVGEQAARQGYVLVSGNARGADRTAQEACLQAGGQVISVIADRLDGYKCRENVLYISEDDFSSPFSAPRALSRNRLIHALGRITTVAQCTYGKGGTWSGTTQNLRHGWSPVFCFRDGSHAANELQDRGACLIGAEQLSDLQALQGAEISLFDGLPME